MIEEKELRQKLLSIIRKPSKLKSHPCVLVPPESGAIPASQIFRSDTSVHLLELGSGWGEFAIEWLRAHPDHEILALEVKSDRIYHTLKEAERNRISGLKMLQVNFNWFLEELLPLHSFDWIIVNFPDPWPKRRHWKHRLVRPGFAERMASLLRPGGILHLATDYSPYARRMLSVMRASTLFEPVFQNPDYRRERPVEFPCTRFERMQIRQGYRPYFMQWRLRQSHDENSLFRPEVCRNKEDDARREKAATDRPSIARNSFAESKDAKITSGMAGPQDHDELRKGLGCQTTPLF